MPRQQWIGLSERRGNAIRMQCPVIPRAKCCFFRANSIYYIYQNNGTKAGEYMPGDKEMINNLIDNYTSLQRIKSKA